MTNKEIDLLFKGFDVKNATLEMLIKERDYVKQTSDLINRSIMDLNLFTFNGCYERVGDEVKKALDSLIVKLEKTYQIYSKQALRFDITLFNRFNINVDNPEVVEENETIKHQDNSTLMANTKQK